jgi:hypothetical protein
VDAGRFDALVRALTEAVTRRAALGLTFSGALGLSLGLADTEAKKKRKKKCKGGKKKCGKKCIPKTACCGGCSDGQICQTGACVCPTECCADADCPSGSGEICEDGACVCPSGQEDSGGVCGTPPTCQGSSVGCSPPGPSQTCCGGECLLMAGMGVCVSSANGEPCHTTDDCSNPQSICRGFVCVNP